MRVTELFNIITERFPDIQDFSIRNLIECSKLLINNGTPRDVAIASMFVRQAAILEEGGKRCSIIELPHVYLNFFESRIPCLSFIDNVNLIYSLVNNISVSQISESTMFLIAHETSEIITALESGNYTTNNLDQRYAEAVALIDTLPLEEVNKLKSHAKSIFIDYPEYAFALLTYLEKEELKPENLANAISKKYSCVYDGASMEQVYTYHSRFQALAFLAKMSEEEAEKKIISKIGDPSKHVFYWKYMYENGLKVLNLV